MTEEKLIVWHPSSRASEELRKAIWEELSTINNPVKIMETNFSSMISLFFFFFHTYSMLKKMFSLPSPKDVILSF